MTFRQRLSTEVLERLRTRVRERLDAEGLDAVLTEEPEDVAYLTGFFHHPSERPVAVWLDTSGRCVLLLPDLEREYAAHQGAVAELAVFAEFPGVVAPYTALADAVGDRRRRVGHNPSVPYSRLEAARTALPSADLVPTSVVERSRWVKEPEEVALHREAARVTDLMLAAGVELVTAAAAGDGPLPTESELAAHVTSVGVRTMYAEHEDVVVVSPLAGGLVYAGENSSFPHGLPSGRRLAAGDTFMLSLGCAVGGRFVEGERTFVLGEPSAEQRRYHDVVREAQRVGGEAIAPGVPCREANARCLAVVREAGLGQYLRHRQGHGIGLGMHESPWLEDGDDTVLLPGMVVSNEPGVYVPGHAGYRISDSVLVTDGGSEPLTSTARALDHCVIPYPSGART